MYFTPNNINDSFLLSTATSAPQICGINEDTADVAISILYFFIFIPALILNGLALWVSCHLESKSTFMVYLKNLMVVDLLMALTVPLEAAKHLPHSPAAIREICCRYFSVLFYACMYMSIILLGVISLDRFFKIVRPWNRLMGQNLLFGKVVSASIWVIYMFFIVFPTIILTNQKTNDTRKEFCIRMKSEAGKMMHDVVIKSNTVIVCVVFIVVVFCYASIAIKVYQSYRNSQSNNDNVRRGTRARVFLVLGIFLMCYGPYHAIRLTYTKLQLQKNGDKCKILNFRIGKELTLWLSAINICLDPFMYFYICRAFREKLCELCHWEASSSFQSSSIQTRQHQTPSVNGT